MISVLMPTYNGAGTILQTIKSLSNQTFGHFELIICDDKSSDQTLEIVKSFDDPRIKVFQNKDNLGYPKNLQRALSFARCEIVFLLAQDDILFEKALEKTYLIYSSQPEVYAITRPYFWFEKEMSSPIRLKKRLPEQSDFEDKILNINDKFKDIVCFLSTLDQLSGLSFRNDKQIATFSEEIFPAHSIPLIKSLRDHKVAFLSEFNVAVRAESSQSRSLSSIYDTSPVETWTKVINELFPKDKYYDLNLYILNNFCARNFFGLIQIKNYSNKQLIYLIREIKAMIALDFKIIFNPIFVAIFFFLLFSPRSLSRKVTDLFKSKVLSKYITLYKFLD